MGSRAADVTEIVPAIRDQLTDLRSPPVLQGQEVRFRLCHDLPPARLPDSTSQGFANPRGGTRASPSGHGLKVPLAEPP